MLFVDGDKEGNGVQDALMKVYRLLRDMFEGECSNTSSLWCLALQRDISDH